MEAIPQIPLHQRANRQIQQEPGGKLDARGKGERTLPHHTGPLPPQVRAAARRETAVWAFASDPAVVIGSFIVTVENHSIRSCTLAHYETRFFIHHEVVAPGGRDGPDDYDLIADSDPIVKAETAAGEAVKLALAHNIDGILQQWDEAAMAQDITSD